MAETETFTLKQAAEKLHKPEHDIESAIDSHLGKTSSAIISRPDLEKLRTYFLELDTRKKGQGRRIETTRSTGAGPRTQVSASVRIEQRRDRSKRKRPVVAAPPPPPAPSPPPAKPAPPPAAPAASREAEERARQARLEQAKKLEQLHQRQQQQAQQAAAPEPAPEPKPEAKPETPPAAAAPAAPARQAPAKRTVKVEPGVMERRKERRRRRPSGPMPKRQEFAKPVKERVLTVEVPERIETARLAEKMAVKVDAVIAKLQELDLDDVEELDQDTACLVVEEFNHRPVRLQEEAARLIMGDRGSSEQQVRRPPIVTVMGHVNHGKTTLLDHIRKSRVTEGEDGGITQHIGAYQVQTEYGVLTMIDTPGHEVFSEMRSRGANLTDIVVLVVAVDDGVQPQTLEALAHARDAGVEIIVALNKIDLPGTDKTALLNELAAHGLETTPIGGSAPLVEISALQGKNVDALLKEIIDIAEVHEFKAPLDVEPHGTVIEAKTEKGLGPVATAIVKEGTLRKGQYVICDVAHGKLRELRDENGKVVKEAGPAAPVQIQGLSELPPVGCDFYVTTEQRARDYIKEVRYKHHHQHQASNGRPEHVEADSIQEMLQLAKALDEKRVFNLVVKADVAGTREAMLQALAKIGNDHAENKVVLSGLGAITESDAHMALASGATLIGFRVAANSKARKLIEDRKLQVYFSDVFYEVTDYVKAQLEGMLQPLVSEEVRGVAEVKELFMINKVGRIAGCGVLEGVIDKTLPVRVVRDGKIVNKTRIAELKHYKNDVASVKSGSDCGISLERFSDFKPGDHIETYEEIRSAQKL